MGIIEQLVYKITGDNSEFDKSIDKSETKVSKFGSVADKMFAGVTVAAIGMAIKKMGEMVMASATALDRVDKLSQKIGISRTAFQEWDYIIGQSGASVEGLQMGIKTLASAADEASKGNKQYKDSFDKLGVSVTDTNGQMKDQEALFSEVFSALADMENQTERTALASDLLGRSATELAPTLNTSKEDIEGLRQEAHDLGLVYSDELVDAGVVLGDNIDRLKKSFGAFKTNALAPIIGLAVTFTDKILGQYSASGKLKTSYNNLTQAAQDYNTVLEDSKGKTDAVTQATLSQAKAQLELALQKASENYKDARDEIEKYNKTIDTSSKWIEKYNRSLGDLAKGTGYTADELNVMTEAERNLALMNSTQAKTTGDLMWVIDTYNTQLLARQEFQKDLIEATTNLSQAEASQENFINLLTQGYIANNEVTKLLLDAYPELQQKVLNNVEAYKKEQEAIKARDKAIELAQKAFAAYGDANEETLNRIIKMAEGHEDSVYWAEMSRLATEKLNELIVENSLVTDKQTAILANNAQGMQAIEKYSLALGDSYDANAEKVSLLTSTIKSLIDAGVNPESEAVANLVAQLKALGTTTEEVTNTSVESFNAEAKARGDAYAKIEESRMSDKDKALKAIQEQADAYLKAGVSIVDVATWQKNELGKLQKQQADKAKEEAEKVRKAWEDATFSMLGSVTSIWSSINQVQANQNEEEIQRIEEQNAIAIQAAKDRGASEEEVTTLEESLQADLNDAKNKYAKEEAERNKALSTLSVILDTAKAIMQIWANPLIAPWGKGVWTGLAAGAGAAQIAAINSAPVPSYDVGSIRIPETTTATVHKDEMILTAPQAEQARREGITIAPNSGSGNSVTLMIYLDGKEIAKNTIDNLNSGSVGTIRARVVK